MTKKIMIINGPNLNLLGQRQPEVYGHTTLSEIEELCHKQAKDLGFTVDFRQSNHEGEIVDWLQLAAAGYVAVIINPAAYTHTSIAIRDAAAIVTVPLIEVHLSNIYARERFRHNSYLSPLATGVISGLGVMGYTAALTFISAKIA